MTDDADVTLTEENVCGYCGATEDLLDSKPAQDLGVFRGVRVLWCRDREACQERVRSSVRDDYEYTIGRFWELFDELSAAVKGRK